MMNLHLRRHLFRQKLPPNWERRINPENGQPYYINHETGQRQLFSPNSRPDFEERLRLLRENLPVSGNLEIENMEPPIDDLEERLRNLTRANSQGSSQLLGSDYSQGSSEEYDPAALHPPGDESDNRGSKRKRKLKNIKKIN